MERLLPQNIEAECGVLGSIIIDPEAILHVADFLSSEDFYRDAHRSIYEVIMVLYEQQLPADFITVCDELERRNKLHDVGGPAYITSLVNAVPTSGNVEYYARIVERTSMLRRLIHVSSEIAGLAYGNEDATEVLDRAEQLIFAISERHARSDFSPLNELISRYMEKLDRLHDRRGTIVGVPTGFADLDRLTGGLQRSDLIILAARPAVGKTSLALTLAHNSAVKYKQSVAVFSLEMSKDQLVQRLLSMDAAIDQHRLRTGWVEDEEWERVVSAMEKLNDANIWIDDTASISTMEMRSKARRLQAEHGVDLIIVDYLQLMQSSSSKRSENRVQEISEISRNLKGLARELDVPVLALAQLSRAVETRQSKVPQLSDLRESGCLAGETLIYLPDEGVSRPIEQLVGQRGFRVLALNEETNRLEPQPVTHAFATGYKPVYKLTTQRGVRLRATGNHQFLSLDGWKRLDKLGIGERIAVPRRTTSVMPSAGQGGATGVITNTLSADQERGMSSCVSATVPWHQDDIYWDEIIAREPDGSAQVYDLTVSQWHNFIANECIVHNSIEQDADVVMFIYRDDVYNPDTDRKNIADLIVAKHRNGPIGEVSLYFKASQTRFCDLEAETSEG